MRYIKIIIMSLFLTSCAKDMFEFNPYTTIVKQLYMEGKKKNEVE